MYKRQHGRVKVSLSGSIAKPLCGVGIKVSHLLDPSWKLQLARGQVTHRSAANKFAVGFKNIGDQYRPHIDRRAEVSTKDPVVVGPIDWRINKENTLVPAELAQVADISSASRQLGLSDHPIKIVHGEGTV